MEQYQNLKIPGDFGWLRQFVYRMQGALSALPLWGTRGMYLPRIACF